MDLHLDLVLTDLLDRLAELDALGPDLVAALAQDLVHVAARDRPVEVAALVDALLDAQHARLEHVLHGLGVVQGRGLACLAGTQQRLGLLLGPGRGEDRLAAGDQVVAAVAVRDLDDVTGEPEVVDLFLEDDLHRRSPQRPAYGISAISRAFLIASLRRDWHLAQAPVWRRALMRTRSFRYGLSVARSL